MRKKLRDKETFRKTSGLFEKNAQKCVEKRERQMMSHETQNVLKKRDGEIKTRLSWTFTRNMINIDEKIEIQFANVYN